MNRLGPAGTAAALRSSAAPMMNTIPIGAGALVGPGGGQVLGLVGLGDEPPGDGPGAAIDARLDDLDARVSALEAAEAGEVA